MDHDTRTQAIADALPLFDKAGMFLTDDEIKSLEVTDLGLGRFDTVGLVLHVYVLTDRYCAKEIVMLPHQMCPEHRHPPVPEANDPGKMETFRVRFGHCDLWIADPQHQGEPSTAFDYVANCNRQIAMKPGDQFTIPPNTCHWFQAGPDGAVISEFSSTSRDELDIFTDPAIRRVE